MKNSLFICAASAFLIFADPGHAETPAADDTISEGVFAVAGACVWAPSRVESGVGAAFIAEATTNLVRSFVTALQRAAEGRTHVSSATLIIDPARHECIQFVRGDLSVTAQESDTRTALDSFLGADAAQKAARLHANGVRLSSPPSLIIEVRLHTIRESATSTRLVVLEPSFIGYREPAFEQFLRFWDGHERTFAFQLQLAETPNAPTAIASGGQLQLGTREPSNERLHINMNGAPSPGSSLAFQMKTGELYNARVNVSESSSESAFMTFWADVIAAEPVQTAATNVALDAVSAERRENAENTAYAAYATKRSALGTLVNACPVAVNDAARDWVMTERANLVQAIDAFMRAADDADVNTTAFPSLAQEAGTAEIVTWCGQASGFLDRH